MNNSTIQLLQKLKNSLIESRQQIRYFHQFTVTPSEATGAWKVYEELSPAMSRINESIKEVATVLEYVNEKEYQKKITPNNTGMLD